MAHREFVDSTGTKWQMWEVYPALAERRRTRNGVPPAPMAERRVKGTGNFTIASLARSGWLALQSATERRRIAEVPEGWSTRSDDELRELLKVSESTGKRRRLIE